MNNPQPFMQIDPSLAGKQPAPFTLSIEIGVAGWPVFTHPFHLGTDIDVAKSFAMEIFERCRRGDYQLRISRVPQHCTTVALMREGMLFDVWDGRDWANDLHEKLYEDDGHNPL